MKHANKTKAAEPSDMVTYDEAAKLVGLKLSTLYSKVSRKEVPHFRLGRRLVVFSRKDLVQWMTERRVSEVKS